MAVMPERPFSAVWSKCEQSAATNQGATPLAANCIDDEVPRAVLRRSQSPLADGLLSKARWFGVSF